MSETNSNVDVLPKYVSDNLPSMVRNELVKLSAQKQEEFVEGGILQYMINLAECNVLASPKREGCYPLPVAVMT